MVHNEKWQLTQQTVIMDTNEQEEIINLGHFPNLTFSAELFPSYLEGRGLSQEEYEGYTSIINNFFFSEFNSEHYGVDFALIYEKEQDDFRGYNEAQQQEWIYGHAQKQKEYLDYNNGSLQEMKIDLNCWTAKPK